MVRLRHKPNVQPSVDATAFDKLGSDCSGSDGAANRILTLANTSVTTSVAVFVSGVFAHPVHDYTASHKAAGTTITFLGDIHNDDLIDGYYFI